MSPPGRLRILGLTMDAGADFRARPGAKNAGLYAALAERHELVGMVRPELPRAEDLVHKLLHAHPDRARWRHRYNKSPLTFRRRTAVAERALQAWEGRYDLIVQLHTLVAPGLPRRGPGGADRPYVIHTDNTYALTERHYPPWAPLRGRARDEWLALERAVYQGARCLFPRSAWLARSLVDDYGCDPARVIVVGGGANLRATSLQQKRWDRQTALFVGLEFDRKGGHVLVEAWRRVRARLPGARLQIVGDLPRGARAGTTRDGIDWIGKVGDRAELARLYEQASLFVMPSLFEPWGHVFYEAMGAGLPCVGTQCCAMPEIVTDGVTGRLVPPGEVRPLADALVGLLEDPATAERMGREAWTRVQAGHTWADVVGRMTPAMEGVVGG